MVPDSSVDHIVMSWLLCIQNAVYGACTLPMLRLFPGSLPLLCFIVARAYSPHAGLELQPEDWLTMDSHGEVLGKLGRKASAVESFKLSVRHEMQEQQQQQ